jgi:hypothetical protein
LLNVVQRVERGSVTAFCKVAKEHAAVTAGHYQVQIVDKGNE